MVAKRGQQSADAKRRYNREYMRRYRRKANGTTPREQSLSRTKPWDAEGLSRATWYRRRKAGRPVRSALDQQQRNDE